MSLQYAYCRISTTDQNIDRQIIAIKQFAPTITDNNIFIDKKTGKDFEREQYQEMKVILEHISKANSNSETIELIVEELDRLGRNADLIKKELMWFKEHNIIVRILEIPTTLIEVDESNRWVMEMVTNLLIEVYAQLAQAELEKRANSDMKIAFSMYPTSIDELFAVADANMLMPPKSTWFEPKLRSGFLIHPFSR